MTRWRNARDGLSKCTDGPISGLESGKVRSDGRMDGRTDPSGVRIGGRLAISQHTWEMRVKTRFRVGPYDKHEYILYSWVSAVCFTDLLDLLWFLWFFKMEKHQHDILRHSVILTIALITFLLLRRQWPQHCSYRFIHKQKQQLLRMRRPQKMKLTQE